MKAQRVLEINMNHPILQKLQSLYETDRDALKTYADLLYSPGAPY